MYRVDTPTSVSVYGGFGPAGTPGHFSSGNPTVGQRGTIPGCDWFEGLQEELMSLLTAGGIVPQKGNVRQLYQSILAMQLLIDNGSGGANALVCAPLVPFDSLNLNTILWILPAATNTGGATFNLGIGGNAALLRPDGSPLQAGDYIAGRPFPAIYLSGAWRMLLNRVTMQLGAAGTITVNALSGNDATGNFANPFQTLQGAWNWLLSNINVAGNILTANCSGAFAAGINAVTPVQGAGNYDRIVFNFAPGSTLNTASDGFIASGGAAFTVTGGLTLSSSGGSGLRIYDDGKIGYGGVNFAACANDHIVVAENGRATPLASYTVSGGAQCHMQAYDAGRVRPGAELGAIVQVTGNPTFSNAFAYCNAASIISLPSSALSFSGAAVGQRYYAGLNGVIYTQGAGASFFPGTIAGTTTAGGQYA